MARGDPTRHVTVHMIGVLRPPTNKKDQAKANKKKGILFDSHLFSLGPKNPQCVYTTPRNGVASMEKSKLTQETNNIQNLRASFCCRFLVLWLRTEQSYCLFQYSIPKIDMISMNDSSEKGNEAD